MLRRLYRKIFRREISVVSQYLKSGIIEVGEGCEISGMNLLIVDPKPGVANLQIGNNTCIRGTIIIYKRNSFIGIGNDVYIGPGTILECVENINIGNNVLISADCNIFDTNSHSIHSENRLDDTKDWQKGLIFKNWEIVRSEKVSIGDKCWIGLRSIIMKGVTLGIGTIVGAGSVVTKNTDSFSIVVGNPARFIKKAD